MAFLSDKDKADIERSQHIKELVRETKAQLEEEQRQAKIKEERKTKNTSKKGDPAVLKIDNAIRNFTENWRKWF